MKSLSLGNKILFILNNIFALLLFIAYLTTFISPLFIKYTALINFSIPFLWVINILFIIIWLIQLKKQVFLSIIVIALGWYHVQKIFVFSNVHHQYSDGLKVMSYNVMQFYSKEDKRKRTYKDIHEFVIKQNPDIVCTQEFKVFDNSLFPEYKYNIESQTSKGFKTNVLSKYPIVNHEKFGFGISNNSAVYADIVKGEDTLRVFSIHFESLNLKPSIENFNEEPKEKLIKRLGKTFTRQIEQLNTLKPHIENSPYPVVICADMNNTGLSYMYRQLVNLNLKDSFLESGHYFGKTFNFGFLPVRIDMILIDESLKSSNFKNYTVKYSDHYPIMTEIHL